MKRALQLAPILLASAGCFSPRADIPAPDPNTACVDPPSSQSARIESTAAERARTQDQRRAELFDPDRITVVTCGTAAPIPSDRAQACTAVFVGGRMFVFDAGDRAQFSMEQLGLPVDDVHAVFLTHFHSDHIADLGEVISRSWILGRDHDLRVFGPPGVERVVDGFNQVYALDEGHRNDHHGDEWLPLGVLAAQAREFANPPVDGAVVYDEDGVVIRAHLVDHAPIEPAVGYRIEHRGRVVGISGDTIDAPGLHAIADGADILVAEVMDKHFTLDASCGLARTGDPRGSAIFRDILDYHIDSLELAQLAEAAGVETLMLTHLVPALPPAQAQTYFTGPMRVYFTRELIVSEDGSTKVLQLP